ncbi:MAG: phenylacetate--CoA ligase [Coriobacteriia bacterium]|nr:phenylacetate--CoA ligase [Coriobacteriia bacterium]
MTETYYQAHEECLDRSTLEELQARRLRALVVSLDATVPFYRQAFKDAGVDPASVEGLQDLPTLPFTVKNDLRAAYPYKMFSASMDDIVRIHASSGTTGQISVVGYTRADLEMWAQCVSRALVAAGATSHDILQVSYGYGIFTGGLGLHDGATYLGMSVIPASGGNTKRQIQFLRDFGVAGLACTPSYALLIAETARDMGLDPTTFPLRFGIFGAEAWSVGMREELEQAFDIKAYDIYGLSEILGPGVAFECSAQQGLHVNEDHFLTEIVDPQTLLPVEEGEYGEIVFTTLTKQGIPLLRYRTRDISRFITEPCSCGRTLRRLDRLRGRSDDMLIIRGVNVFPSQIEQVLTGVAEVSTNYQIIVSRTGRMDNVLVKVEIEPDFPADEIARFESIERQVRAEIESALAISVQVRLVEPKSIARSEGKAQRLIDERKEN